MDRYGTVFENGYFIGRIATCYFVARAIFFPYVFRYVIGGNFCRGEFRGCMVDEDIEQTISGDSIDLSEKDFGINF